MASLCRSIKKGLDWNNILAYRSNKVVLIRDKRLGLLHLVFIIAACIYIGYQTIYIDNGWAVQDTALGNVKLTLTQPTNSIVPSSPYCSANCVTFSGYEPGCNCAVWDASDLVYPEEQEYSIFIATRMDLTVNETKTPGCDPVSKICTSPWAGGLLNSFYLVDVQDFEVGIFHEAIAPNFYQQGASSQWLRTSSELWGQLVNLQGNAIMDFHPISSGYQRVPFSTLLLAAGLTYEDVRVSGGMLSVIVTYGDCSTVISASDTSAQSACRQYKTNVKTSMNYYQYRVSWVPSSTYSIVRTVYSINQQMRSLRNATGVRITFRITGTQVQFSFSQLLISLVSGYILLSFAAFVVDALVLFVLPGRKLYSNAKYEVTENFGSLRKNIESERNQKKRLKKLTNMARFKDTQEVIDTLDTLQLKLTEAEQDELILACIKVYGQELRDFSNANKLIAMLAIPENKIKANIMLDQLLDAFRVAAQMNSLKDVRAVREECLRMNQLNIVSMCDTFIENALRA